MKDGDRREPSILLVEDNVVDVECVRRAFARQPIANPMIVARDGREALDLLRSGSMAPPVLVLLDLNLPRMSGLEFLLEIRNDPNLSKLVVFVLTTSNREEDRVESYQLNVAGYILKRGGDAGLSFLSDLVAAYFRAVVLPLSPAPD